MCIAIASILFKKSKKNEKYFTAFNFIITLAFSFMAFISQICLMRRNCWWVALITSMNREEADNYKIELF
jgi:hypothetical protein